MYNLFSEVCDDEIPILHAKITDWHNINRVLSFCTVVFYTNIDQKLVNSLHGLLNCEIGGLDCRVITIEYRTRVQCIHM